MAWEGERGGFYFRLSYLFMFEIDFFIHNGRIILMVWCNVCLPAVSA